MRGCNGVFCLAHQIEDAFGVGQQGFAFRRDERAAALNLE
jgi:hypothetical protein